jgi:hypothetical protein
VKCEDIDVTIFAGHYDGNKIEDIREQTLDGNVGTREKRKKLQKEYCEIVRSEYHTLRFGKYGYFGWTFQVRNNLEHWEANWRIIL